MDLKKHELEHLIHIQEKTNADSMGKDWRNNIGQTDYLYLLYCYSELAHCHYGHKNQLDYEADLYGNLSLLLSVNMSYFLAYHHGRCDVIDSLLNASMTNDSIKTLERHKPAYNSKSLEDVICRQVKELVTTKDNTVLRFSEILYCLDVSLKSLYHYTFVEHLYNKFSHVRRLPSPGLNSKVFLSAAKRIPDEDFTTEELETYVYKIMIDRFGNCEARH